MWLILLTSVAFGTELRFALETDEGTQEQWSLDHMDSFTETYGPLAKGKKRVKYEVAVMPSVYDPLQERFRTQISICRSWSKGSKRDQDCVSETMLVPPKAEGPVVMGGKVKGSEKFELRFGAYYEGAPPLPGGQEPEPEPEQAAEAAPEPEPEVDEEAEMTSALENIASEIVSGLQAEDDSESSEESDESAAPEAEAADDETENRKKKRRSKD